MAGRAGVSNTPCISGFGYARQNHDGRVVGVVLPVDFGKAHTVGERQRPGFRQAELCLLLGRQWGEIGKVHAIFVALRNGSHKTIWEPKLHAGVPFTVQMHEQGK